MGVLSMLELIKLEIEKHNLKRYIVAAVISNLIISLFLFMMIATEGDSSIPEELGEGLSYSALVPNLSAGFDLLDSLVKTVFVVFASVLIARLIIDEYRNKTISVMFMYPISRKKLIWMKLMIVMVFTIGAIFLSDVFQAVFLFLLNKIMHFTPDTLTPLQASQAAIKFATGAVAFSGVGLIPMYFGMKKKSVPATIISAVLIVTVLCSNNGDLSLSSIIYIPIALTLLGIVIAYLSFRNIEVDDVV